MTNWLRELRDVLKDTVIAWLEDGIPPRGAALSYYVLLSLGPLLVLIVGILQFFLTEETARASVVAAVRDNAGQRAADTVATILARVEVPELLAPESILTVALLIFGATAVFANVRESLDTIWGVAPQGPSKREMALDLVRARIRGSVMLLVTGLVIALSFAVTSALGLVQESLGQRLPLGGSLLRAIDVAVSFLLTGVLFAAMYRTLPSARPPWASLWAGAFATAFLFVIGKSLVAVLISSASWTSYYGPGASVVAFLAWIYFSAQIFFLGAEFTQVWARRRSGPMKDEGDASPPTAPGPDVPVAT